MSLKNILYRNYKYFVDTVIVLPCEPYYCYVYDLINLQIETEKNKRIPSIKIEEKSYMKKLVDESRRQLDFVCVINYDK